MLDSDDVRFSLLISINLSNALNYLAALRNISENDLIIEILQNYVFSHDKIKNELEKARHKHLPINSLHEGYAILLEEVEEFWSEVKKNEYTDEVKQNMIKELTQIAAISQRIIEDCKLGEVNL